MPNHHVTKPLKDGLKDCLKDGLKDGNGFYPMNLVVFSIMNLIRVHNNVSSARCPDLDHSKPAPIQSHPIPDPNKFVANLAYLFKHLSFLCDTNFFNPPQVFQILPIAEYLVEDEVSMTSQQRGCGNVRNSDIVGGVSDLMPGHGQSHQC